MRTSPLEGRPKVPPLNRPERLLDAALTKAGVAHVNQKPMGRYRADAYLPLLKTVIEVDGKYWHERPRARLRDRRKDAYYAKLGLRVLRVWAEEFVLDRDGWVAEHVMEPPNV